MKTIVLTGGIGSGKTLIGRILSSHGFPFYDCDSRTKALYANPEFALKVAQAAGLESFNKKALADKIFNDKQALAAVEAVVHPVLLQDYIRWRDAQKVEWVVMESAIVLEKPLFHDIVDAIIFVDAPLQTRLKRACQRDGRNRYEILKRMCEQKLTRTLDGVPSYVLENDSTYVELKANLKQIIDNILNNN